MRLTKYLIVIGLILLIGQNSTAQPICGFDIVHNRQMKADPVYRQNVLNGEAFIREYIRNHPIAKEPIRPISSLNLTHPSATSNIISSSTSAGSTIPSPTTLGALYTIPVVVHVIHTGGAIGTIYNPTDAQILGALAYLNSVYNGTWPGTGGAGDLQIQFALAQRDPNCNP